MSRYPGRRNMIKLAIAVVALVLAAPSDTAPAFTAYTVGGERLSGTVKRLAADGSLELAGESEKHSVGKWLSLRRNATPLPSWPRGPALYTAAGDRIPGTIISGDDVSIRFRPHITKGECEVPLTAVSLIWLVRPPADTPFEISRYSWIPANGNRDILRFRNGDTTAGAIERFTDKEEIRFKPENGEARAIPFSELSAIAFNPTLARARKPKGPYYRAVLRDGARIGLATATSDGESVNGKTLFGQTIETPIHDLLSVDVLQGAAIYLADLKPAKVESIGFLGVEWGWMPNRSVRKESLRLLTADGESVFDRGLGTHPKTTLTYDLNGKYRRFESLVGLDSSTGGRGRASVRILLDGKEQQAPGLAIVSAGSVVWVDVDLTGAKQLMLVADFGPTGGVQADVNWADARLIE